MNTTLGNAEPAPPELKQLMRIAVSTAQIPLKWSDCSSTADFLSHYYAGIFALDRSEAQVTDISHSVSYMANELIENAVKFRTEGDVTIDAGVDGGDFLLRIANWIDQNTSTRFRALLEELTAGDPGELLIQRIEANAIDGKGGSGLGILTLMNDYGVRLSWSFRPEDDGRIFLETLARLPVPAAAPSPTTTYRHHGN